MDLGLFNNRLKFKWGRYLPHHAETFRLWASVSPAFTEPIRDLVSDDVTSHVKKGFRHIVAEVMRHQRKPRFIAEYSGWSRIDFMREIFPEAQFIHIVRDGRAVAHSLIHVDYWRGWEGVHRWCWGVPDPPLMAKLERYKHSFLALAAVQWTILVRNIEESLNSLPPSDRLVVRYEDLVKDPVETARASARFLGLDPDLPAFRKHLGCVAIVDANSVRMRIPSWKDNLRSQQVEMLHDLLADDLERFGYA